MRAVLGRRRFVFALLLSVGLCAPACSSSGDARSRRGAGGASGDSAGGGAARGGGGARGGSLDGGLPDTPSVCVGGCDGGTCVDSMCCPVDLACGNTCCERTQVCAFGACVEPGEECLDSADCGKNAYCDFALGGAPSATPANCHGAVSIRGRCLPKPPECAPGKTFEADDVIDCIVECALEPTAPSFELTEKYAWTKASVISTPIVLQLDDDDCNGRVDDHDIPEIIFTTMNPPEPPDNINPENRNGTVVAISIVAGAVVEKWSYHPSEHRAHPGYPLAGANLDGKPGAEIVYCGDDGFTVALDPSGKVLWSVFAFCTFPAIGDLDQDGVPEVVVRDGVLDGATGTMKGAARVAVPVLSDMDGDGVLDIVGPDSIVRMDGTIVAQSMVGASQQAVADLDKDGVPEVVGVNQRDHTLVVWHYDAAAANHAAVLRQGVDVFGTIPTAPKCSPISVGFNQGGGPPTIADFNGDGYPDVATATGAAYSVFDGKKLMDAKVANADTILWQKETQDCTSAATGSSVFDFNGDGSAEVTYGDELYFRIYRGRDGKELFSVCNTTATLFEYPVVADVDADGHADIVVVANDHRVNEFSCPSAGQAQRGVRVFGDTDGTFVRTRRVWNQHGYHVTNIEEDGTVPTKEKPNWTQKGLNNFRQNRAPGGAELFAPDLIASVFPACHGDPGLVARVRNIGRAFAPAGIPVGFYAGDPKAGGTLLGTVATSVPLYPAQGEDVLLPVIALPTDLVYAVVDDGAMSHAWTECNTDNNQAGPVGPHCLTVW